MTVPFEELYRKLEENAKYEEEREHQRKNLTKKLSSDIFHTKYKKLQKDQQNTIQDLVLEQLPNKLKPRFLHSDEELLKLIPDEAIKNYVKHYETNTGERSYIEIPVGENQTSIADVIADHKRVLVHCFLYDAKNQELNYKASLGPVKSGDIASILIHGSHYWALYHPNESEKRRKGIIQAAENWKAWRGL